VGWFTAIHPLRLQVPDDAREALLAAKERIRAVPNRGIGWGLLRWLADDAIRARLARLPRPAVSFNYLGRMDTGGEADGGWSSAEADPGAGRAPGARRPHSLSVDAVVADGRLHVSWGYAPAAHSAAEVERLAGAYLAALAEIAEHCRAAEAGGFTPSDFDLAELDQATLDAVLSQVDAA
jgi:non-ribosomal peptide synthase protein (TIGR01720 family)